MNLNRLKLSQRLALGFGAVLLLLAGVAATSYSRLVLALDDTHAASVYVRRANLVDTWLQKSQLNITRVVAIAKASGQPDISAHFAPLIKATTEEISAIQKDVEAAIDDDGGKALMARVAEKRKAYIDLRTELYALLKLSDQPAVDALLSGKLLPASEAYLAAMGELRSAEARSADLRNEKTVSNLRTTQIALAAMVALGLGLGVALAIGTARSITLPLREAVAFARRIADRDLSQHIDSSRGDELGDLLRALSAMQVSLSAIVGQVRASTDSIGTASAEIATGNQDLSVRTEQTASNLQQAASSMAQLTGTVRQSADSARQANQLASSAAEVAARGGQVVSQVVTTMDDINTSSKKISDIIGVIDGIAFQTNILALNAAVEAARAGEQGRGFAVVASEVRSLAQRSAQAAKEIKGLIGASVDRVEAGSRLVADAGKTMQEIVGSVQRVSDIIGEITASSVEQSEGIGHVSTAVTQLDRMTQQNAALVEQSAAAAESLREQAGRLSAAVGQFSLAA